LQHAARCSGRTIEAALRAQDGLDDAQHALEALLDIGILGGDGVLLLQHHLQVVVRLLVLEVADALIQAVDLVLGALANGTLGLAVVCALPRELLGGEVGDAAGVGPRPALLIGLPIFGLLAVSQGRARCARVSRGRHADQWATSSATQQCRRELSARVMKLARHGGRGAAPWLPHTRPRVSRPGFTSTSTSIWTGQ
jgi:hypothetical protein